MVSRSPGPGRRPVLFSCSPLQLLLPRALDAEDIVALRHLTCKPQCIHTFCSEFQSEAGGQEKSLSVRLVARSALQLAYHAYVGTYLDRVKVQKNDSTMQGDSLSVSKHHMHMLLTCQFLTCHSLPHIKDETDICGSVNVKKNCIIGSNNCALLSTLSQHEAKTMLYM